MGILSAVQSMSLTSIQDINEQIGISQNRLATGKKIFSAADDATKFKLSEAMLMRSKALTDVNDNLTVALKTINSATTSLSNIKSTINNMQKIARQAQTDIADSSKSFTGTGVTAATVFAASGATDLKQRQIVVNAGATGKSFTYTIPQAGDMTVGAFVNALNAANIGISASFNASGLTFTSTSGGDITFGGSSDEAAMAQLLVGATIGGVTLTAANVGAFAAAAFANQATVAANATSNRTVTLATNIVATDTLAAASTISLSAPDGTVRQLNFAAGATIQNVIDGINGLGITGITASLVTNANGISTFQLNNTSNYDSNMVVTGSLTGVAGRAAAAVGAVGALTLGLANGVLTRNITLASATETGATISFGASLAIGLGGTLENDVLKNGGTLSFLGADGSTQSVTLAANSRVKDLIAAVNATNSGISAEIIQVSTGNATSATQLQLRNTRGGAINIISATGDFTTAAARIAGTAANPASVTFGIPATGTSKTVPPLAAPSATRNEYIAKMTKYRADIDRYASEAGLPGGRNILSNQNLTVVLSEGVNATPDTIVITGNPITANSLGVTGTFTLADDVAITTDISNLQLALTRVQDEQTRLGSNQNYIQARFDMNKSVAASLQTDGDQLVAMNQEEESAKLAALNTKASLAVQSYSLANQAMQSLLQLLR